MRRNGVEGRRQSGGGARGVARTSSRAPLPIPEEEDDDDYKSKMESEMGDQSLSKTSVLSQNTDQSSTMSGDQDQTDKEGKESKDGKDGKSSGKRQTYSCAECEWLIRACGPRVEVCEA